MDQINQVGRNTMMGLLYGERFIIWSLRRIVTERGPDSVLLDECMSAFNEDGEAGLRILSAFLSLLGRSARRKFDIGSPAALFLTWDERRILILLAAAQVTGEDGRSLLDAHLRWHATLPYREELSQLVVSLARLLNVHGHPFFIACQPAMRMDDEAPPRIDPDFPNNATTKQFRFRRPPASG